MLSIIFSFAGLLLMLWNLVASVEAHYVPGTVVYGLFSMIAFSLFLEALPGSFKKPARKINRATLTYEFAPEEMTWADLKTAVETYYRGYGFTDVVIDKAATWMAKNPDHEDTYILISDKDGVQKLEAYNTHAFETGSLKPATEQGT